MSFSKNLAALLALVGTTFIISACSGGGGDAGGTGATTAQSSSSSPSNGASNPTGGSSNPSGGQGSGNPGGGITPQVSNGLPNQKSMTLSAVEYGLDWLLNGYSVKVTVQVANTAGNPVPDGTTVQFSAEGGQIETACNLKGTIVGASSISQCSVNFVVQNPRPLDGTVSVIAWLQGQEAFTDVNGNGLYDANEPYYDSGIPYRDDNGNGAYDVGVDSLVITAGTPAVGTSACNPGGSLVFVNQPPYSVPNTCSGSWGNGYVSAQIVFPLSNNDIEIEQAGPGQFIVYSKYDPRGDGNFVRLPPPTATTLSVSALNGSQCQFDGLGLDGNKPKEPPRYSNNQFFPSQHSIIVIKGCPENAAKVTAAFGSKSISRNISL